MLEYIQTRIFAPVSELTESWYPTLLGKVIKPITETHPELGWFWFSQYYCERDHPDCDNGDCDIEALPENYLLTTTQVTNKHFSVRFRLAVPVAHADPFQGAEEKRIRSLGYWISDWRPFDRLADLGNDLHIGEVPPGHPKREERAGLVTDFYHSLARIILHSLVKTDDGGFRFEKTNSWEAFNREIHLTHNMTATSHLTRTVNVGLPDGRVAQVNDVITL